MTRHSTPVLVAFLQTDEATVRFRRAMQASESSWRTVRVGSWLEVTDILRRHDVSILVLEPPAEDNTYLQAGRRTAERFPSVPIVVYGRFDRWTGSEILDVADALSPSAAITLGVDDEPTRFIEYLDEARDLGTRKRLLTALATSPEAGQLVEVAYTLAGGRPTVAALARDLACSPRTLRRRCRELQLPPPAKLLRLCRLYRAAAQLSEAGRSVHDVAACLEFRGARSLRGALRRIGLPIASVRAHGPELILARWRRGRV